MSAFCPPFLPFFTPPFSRTCPSGVFGLYPPVFIGLSPPFLSDITLRFYRTLFSLDFTLRCYRNLPSVVIGMYPPLLSDFSPLCLPPLPSFGSLPYFPSLLFLFLNTLCAFFSPCYSCLLHLTLRPLHMRTPAL